MSMCGDCVGMCRKCAVCIVQPPLAQNMRTKHTCAGCGKVFTVEHWSSEVGTLATCLHTSAGDFGPYCHPRCRTKHALIGV